MARTEHVNPHRRPRNLATDEEDDYVPGFLDAYGIQIFFVLMYGGAMCVSVAVGYLLFTGIIAVIEVICY